METTLVRAWQSLSRMLKGVPIINPILLSHFENLVRSLGFMIVSQMEARSYKNFQKSNFLKHPREKRTQDINKDIYHIFVIKITVGHPTYSHLNDRSDLIIRFEAFIRSLLPLYFYFYDSLTSVGLILVPKYCNIQRGIVNKERNSTIRT